VHGFLAAGSNLGDREGNLRAGLEGLAGHRIRLLEVSSLWETEPVGGAGPGWFLNLCASIETPLTPHDLLSALLRLEEEAGRVRAARNAPRTLDLDLLTLDDLTIATPELTLPHPRMWQRGFVLAPLAEIAPALRNPATGRTVAEELATLPDRSVVRRLGPIALRRGGPV
jgi:2-amino-4-hydroxy-6-hydroxymethyldihydropteridine diphosphokinase